MTASNLINEAIPRLNINDSCNRALSIMEEYNLTHLPVTDNEQYKGLISDLDIYRNTDFTAPVKDCLSPSSMIYVEDNDHFFLVLKIAAEKKLDILPVVDENKMYLGSITYRDMIQFTAVNDCVFVPGGIIVLELNANDYMLSQIAQIIESNDARILGLWTMHIANSVKIELTIKTNKTDFGAILQTFERYHYTIKAVFSDTEDETLLKERYDALLRYLNV